LNQFSQPLMVAVSLPCPREFYNNLLRNGHIGWGEGVQIFGADLEHTFHLVVLKNRYADQRMQAAFVGIEKIGIRECVVDNLCLFGSSCPAKHSLRCILPVTRRELV
jgi:hypothetical protein